MRKSGVLAGALVAAAMMFATAADAQAGAISVAFGTHSKTAIGQDGNNYGHGGEFKVTSFEGSYASNLLSADVPKDDNRSLFNTFCLERNQSLSGITNYQRSTAAQPGGIGSTTGDPLDDATAKLYYAFWADAWTAGADYNYDDVGGTRVDDAANLQLAIWYLENEVPVAALTGGASAYVNFANTVTWQQLGQNWTGTGGVMVLNTFDDAGANKQDLLVVVPLPPAALSGLALLGSVALLGGLRRRRRRTAG